MKNNIKISVYIIACILLFVSMQSVMAIDISDIYIEESNPREGVIEWRAEENVSANLTIAIDNVTVLETYLDEDIRMVAGFPIRPHGWVYFDLNESFTTHTLTAIAVVDCVEIASETFDYVGEGEVVEVIGMEEEVDVVVDWLPCPSDKVSSEGREE